MPKTHWKVSAPVDMYLLTPYSTHSPLPIHLLSNSRHERTLIYGPCCGEATDLPVLLHAVDRHAHRQGYQIVLEAVGQPIIPHNGDTLIQRARIGAAH